MSSITTRLTVAFAVIVTATTALLLALGGWLLAHQLGDGIRLFDTGLPMSRWTREAVRSLPSGLVQVQLASHFSHVARPSCAQILLR